MWLGNLVSGRVVDHFTDFTITPNIIHWSKVWAVPAIGAAVCLLLFVMLWRDTEGKVETVEAQGFPIDPIAETAGSTGDPNSVSQTIP